MAITWDQIGSESFIKLDGDIDVQKLTLEEVTRPAADGRAFRKDGEHCDIFTLRGLAEVATGAAADTKITTYSNMIGTNVSIILRGQTRANYLVVNVVTVARKALANSAGGPSGGLGLYLIESEWTLTRSGVE